jgi:hypothetical protein
MFFNYFTLKITFKCNTMPNYFLLSNVSQHLSKKELSSPTPNYNTPNAFRKPSKSSFFTKPHKAHIDPMKIRSLF